MKNEKEKEIKIRLFSFLDKKLIDNFDICIENSNNKHYSKEIY